MNGHYYPVADLDYFNFVDGKGKRHVYTLNKCIEDVKGAQIKSNMHTAHIYKTRNGYQIRFFYDHLHTLNKVRAFLTSMEWFFEHIDPQYIAIIKKYIPSGRVAGKYQHNDIELVAVVTRTQGLTDSQLAVGKSLIKLFECLAVLKLPKKYLLR